MLKLINYTGKKTFIQKAPFSFSILILLKDNKWFDPQWGCYLTNSATLVFTTLKIYKQPAFRKCLIWKVLEPPN